MLERKNSPKGIGVDVVAFSRTEDFYAKHQDSLGKILNPEEQEALKNSRNPSKLLAYFFSAKEAVFKSLDQDWLGVDGFKMIKIDFPREEEALAGASLSGVMKEKTGGRLHEWHLSFLEVNNTVIAQAVSY